MGVVRRAVAGLVSLVVTGAVTGCSDVARGPTGPGEFASPLLDVSASRAETETIHLRTPFRAPTFVPCANGGVGEFVVLSGTLHTLIHETVSSSGNIHTSLHFRPQGVSGEGLVTGDRYRATGATNQQMNFNGPLPITQTFTNNFHVRGQGRDNDLMIHQTVHFTVNANGELTAEVLNTRVQCK